jgi:hypothetical protein
VAQSVCLVTCPLSNSDDRLNGIDGNWHPTRSRAPHPPAPTHPRLAAQVHVITADLAQPDGARAVARQLPPGLPISLLIANAGGAPPGRAAGEWWRFSPEATEAARHLNGTCAYELVGVGGQGGKGGGRLVASAC